MAYQPITWRNINSRSDSAANALLNSAETSFNNAFANLGKSVDGIQSDRKAEYDHLVDTNTQNFLDTVRKYSDLDQLKAAQPTLDKMIAGDRDWETINTFT